MTRKLGGVRSASGGENELTVGRREIADLGAGLLKNFKELRVPETIRPLSPHQTLAWAAEGSGVPMVPCAGGDRHAPGETRCLAPALTERSRRLWAATEVQ